MPNVCPPDELSVTRIATKLAEKLEAVVDDYFAGCLQVSGASAAGRRGVDRRSRDDAG
jgi:hypothetical protein